MGAGVPVVPIAAVTVFAMDSTSGHLSQGSGSVMLWDEVIGRWHWCCRWIFLYEDDNWGKVCSPRGRGISSWHSRRGETERISRVSEGICFPAVSQHVLEGGGAGSEGIPGTDSTNNRTKFNSS